MVSYNINQINALEHLYKINLINCISGYKSANLIGTKSAHEIENVTVFSSVTHFGSEPPLLGMIFRPTTFNRNTYDNIKETGFFTINHIHNEIIRDAHHTSAKYSLEQSEFDYTRLEHEYKSGFFAPYVKGCPVQIGLKFEEEYLIKANGTILLIGEVQCLNINKNMLMEDGFVDLSIGSVATVNGLYGYATPSKVEQLEYQRPKDKLS